MNILNQIVFDPMDADQYFHEQYLKTQIYIHHTASSPSPFGVKKWWNTTPEKIGTAFIIAGKANVGDGWKDGDIIQVFNSSNWAWHLGLKNIHLSKGGLEAKSNRDLNKDSIGIEICNWGQLADTRDGFKSYAGTTVPDDDVTELNSPYRGYLFYEKYTDAQLESVKNLLYYLCNKWSIPTMYKGDSMFDISSSALRGEPGIWGHTSVRPDKTDPYPHPNLIEMLKLL